MNGAAEGEATRAALVDRYVREQLGEAPRERPAVPVQLDLFDRPTAPTPPAADTPKPARSPWPSAGITEAGHWGSRDGLKWERVAEGKLVVSPDHFVMGWIVNTPAEARRAMREGVRSAAAPSEE